MAYWRRKDEDEGEQGGGTKCWSKKFAMIRAEVYSVSMVVYKAYETNSGIEGLMEELVLLVPVTEEPRWKASSPSACFFTRW